MQSHFVFHAARSWIKVVLTEYGPDCLAENAFRNIFQCTSSFLQRICGVSQSNLMYGSSAFIYILFILLPIQRCNRVFLSTFFSSSHLFSVFPSHTGLSSHLSHTQPDVLCAPGSGGRADVLSVPEVFFFSLECVSAPQLTTFLKCSSSVKHKDPPQT